MSDHILLSAVPTLPASADGSNVTGVIDILGKLGVTAQDASEIGAFFSGIPLAVKILVPSVLAILWIVEMLRKDGSLSPKRLFTVQPCTLFFELTLLHTYMCAKRIADGSGDGIVRFFRSLSSFREIGAMIKQPDASLVLPAMLLVFSVAWLITELFSGHIASFPVRLSFKLALLACAAVMTSAGSVGLIIVTVIGLLRLCTYIVFTVYAVAGLFDITKWYKKAPESVSSAVMFLSDTVIYGYGEHHLADGVSRKYGTEAGKAFAGLYKRNDRIDMLDHLTSLVGDRL